MKSRSVLRLAAVLLVLSVARLFPGFLLSLHTGRPVPSPTVPSQSENPIPPTQITQPIEPPTQPEAVVSFSPGDLQDLKIKYSCDYRPDLSKLLTAQLPLLQGKQPTVLIIHTHGSESYKDSYPQPEPYRCLDNAQNMIAVGDEVARVLELAGIRVIHDRNIYDYPDYSGAYSAARKAIREHLARHPDIQMVLDLHRDAADGDYGQLVTTATVGGQSSAQIMFVVGTDAGGNSHPNWQENLSLALKLSVLLEQENPGITRGISLRSQRFNMDMTPGSLLVEMGAAGDTLQEAILAANALANGILTLLGR